MCDSLGGKRADAGYNLISCKAVRLNDLVGAGTRRDMHVFARAHRGDDSGSGPPRELDGAGPDRTGPALDEHHATRYRTGDVDATVCSDARNAEAGPLLEAHAVGQRHRLPGGHHGELGGYMDGLLQWVTFAAMQERTDVSAFRCRRPAEQYLKVRKGTRR